jgi:glycosyltransferase involved in cell wall biosynthesis
MLTRAAAQGGVSPPSEQSSRPIRVARVIARLNIGGPAQHTILLAAGLDRTRFTTTLITGVVGQAEGDFMDAACARGISPIVIPELGRSIRPGRDLTALVKLIRLFRQLRPDIVHTHTAKAGTLGRLAAQVAGVPVKIHTFHGHVLDGYFSPAVTRVFIGMERLLARMTDRLIAISPRLRTQLLTMGIGRPEKVEVIPLGLDLKRFRRACPEVQALRRSLGLQPGVPVLGIVGRLVPIKDHATLFHALALFPPSDAAAHLAVIGDGEERARLEGLAVRLGLGQRIHFLGWRADLETILNELDVVICASRNEGTPVALIEAMAAGVPVLSTDVGGVADLVAHAETGWLVPHGDPSAMARAIRHLLGDHGLRTRLAAAGRAAVLDEYDVSRLIPRVEALYTGVINEKPTTDNPGAVKGFHG